ncbi:MAG: succinate dehydrogenase hydrophobic membrane anchor subunit [Bacteroidota bacterium]
MPAYGARPAPTSSNFELFAWFFMRISGIVLIFMALGHLFIMHILNDVAEIDYAFVAERYATPFWRTYDLIMLFLALFHGVNGARMLIVDYVRSQGWRVVSLSTLYVIAFALLLLGALVIVTFQPVST